VDVPANVTADVWVPAADGALVSEGGSPVGKAVISDGLARIEIGSGFYEFAVDRMA
jgi:hypothetical protein